MKPDKCLGQDGFDPRFFQNNWSRYGDEICNQWCGWLLTCIFPSTVNMTNIALIPKGEFQVSMKDL